MSELTRLQALHRAANDTQDMAGMVQVNRDDLRALLGLEQVVSIARRSEIWRGLVSAVDIQMAALREESGEY